MARSLTEQAEWLETREGQDALAEMLVRTVLSRLSGRMDGDQSAGVRSSLATGGRAARLEALTAWGLTEFGATVVRAMSAGEWYEDDAARAGAMAPRLDQWCHALDDQERRQLVMDPEKMDNRPAEAAGPEPAGPDFPGGISVTAEEAVRRLLEIAIGRGMGRRCWVGKYAAGLTWSGSRRRTVPAGCRVWGIVGPWIVETETGEVVSWHVNGLVCVRPGTGSVVWAEPEAGRAWWRLEQVDRRTRCRFYTMTVREVGGPSPAAGRPVSAAVIGQRVLALAANYAPGLVGASTSVEVAQVAGTSKQALQYHKARVAEDVAALGGAGRGNGETADGAEGTDLRR